jgi:hypothetical protein
MILVTARHARHPCNSVAFVEPQTRRAACQCADCSRPGDTVSQPLCHRPSLASRAVISGPLSCPVISRPALPACYMLCLLPACQLDTTAHLPGASHRHPCNFPFPLMLANSKPRSPAIYQFGVHPIYREPHIVGRFGRISRLSHRICACVKPLMSSASPHYSG